MRKDYRSIMIFFGLLLAIGLFFFVYYWTKRDEEKQRERQAEHHQKIELKNNDERAEYLKWLYEKYTISKIVGLKEGVFWHIDKVFAVDEEKKVVLFGKKEISFDKILNVELRTTTSQRTVTQTKKENPLGKAIVGGVIAGGAGAIVGASMAQETMESNTYSTESISGLFVYIKDMSQPIHEYAFYDSCACREIYAILMAIIESNK